MTDDDQKLLDQRTYFDDVVHAVEIWEDEIDSADEEIKETVENLEGRPSQIEVPEDGAVSADV